MNTLRLLSFIAAIFVLAGCDRDAMSEKGFSLPEGDPAAGREAFVYMQCNQCHTVAGEDLPMLANAEPPYVELGGPVTQVKTYGDLVTAIINPSRKLIDGYDEAAVSEDGESNMYIYNEHMTVKELTDLVMFLQPHYKIIPPNYRHIGHL